MLKLETLLSNSFQSFSHILVPQAVDEGVQHGDHNPIKHRSHFFLLLRLCGTMVQIPVRQRPIENGDSCQVGSARGEAFFLPAAEEIFRMAARINM